MKRCLLFLLICGLTACQKEDDNIKTVQSDIAYGNDPLQKMDIYLPAGRNTNTTKAIILIHGGGWTEGDKTDFTDFVSVIENMLPDYAIFNVNYRLAAGSSNLFPTQENDVKAAIEFIYAKRNDYKISDKFIYLGASAGGHLALLQGYKYSTPVKPKAIVSFFGPADLTGLYNSNPIAGIIIAGVTGNTPAGNPALYEQSSPVSFVNSTSPPTILLHGGVDPLVPPAQAESLQTLLNNAGVPNQYVFYPTEGHGWIGTNLDDSFNKIAAFLNEHAD